MKIVNSIIMAALVGLLFASNFRQQKKNESLTQEIEEVKKELIMTQIVFGSSAVHATAHVSAMYELLYPDIGKKYIEESFYILRPLSEEVRELSQKRAQAIVAK